MFRMHDFRAWTMIGLALAGLAAGSGWVHADEVVYEASFEGEDPLAGWFVYPDNPAVVASEESRSGEYSLKIPPGSRPHKSGILPTDDRPKNLARVDFWTRGGSGKFVNHQFSGASDWTQQRAFVRESIHVNAFFARNTDASKSLYLDDLKVFRATGAEYREHVDSSLGLWGDRPELNRASQTKHRLQSTIAALNSGERQKILMLGDSIQNDTFRSNWDSLLRDRFPNADVEVVKSVRGSTGMDWYSAEFDEDGNSVDRVQEWVLDHNPDMVMLGGISHGQDAEAYRDVIDRVRQDAPDTEFLIMSGLAGSGDPAQTSWSFEPTAEDDPFRHALMQIAAEENVGFLDARAAWNRYITTSNQPLDFFKRDPVHTNTNGQLVAASIVDQFFGQPIPEPSAAVMLIATASIIGLRRCRRS